MKGLLLIVDGMGLSATTDGNAVSRGTMPFLFGLMDRYGVARLEASGAAVGLADGQAGNSEIGHLTIGAGCKLASTLEKIRSSHAAGAWAESPVWQDVARRGPLHVVGLASDAGVHGHVWSLARAAELAVDRGVSEVIVHPVLDGVDGRAGGAVELLSGLARELDLLPRARIGCVIGRKWACDRSGSLEITQHLVRGLHGDGAAPTFRWEALDQHLAASQTEASFPCHQWEGGRCLASGESVLLTNHRADRTEQLARMLAENHEVFSLVELGTAVPTARVFFPTRPLDRGLAFELRAGAIASLRVAEQCKFPHVTYFLNGFRRELGERTVCVPSIAEAAIGEHPEMSLAGVVAAILAAIGEPRETAIIANLANLDQVGHLGRYELAVRAAALIDEALRTIHAACEQHDYALVITSDHGNADAMIDGAGRPLGSHSTNPVPLVVASRSAGELARTSGTLANVAATFLTVMGAKVPAWMEPSLYSVTAPDVSANARST